MYRAAWTTFETEVSSVKEVGDLYDEAVALLSERIRKNADKAVAEWEAKCRDNAAVRRRCCLSSQERVKDAQVYSSSSGWPCRVLQEVVARWKGLFRPQVVGALETPLPVEEAALAQALKEAKAAAVRDLERLYCSQENPWKEVQRQPARGAFRFARAFAALLSSLKQPTELQCSLLRRLTVAGGSGVRKGTRRNEQRSRDGKPGGD